MMAACRVCGSTHTVSYTCVRKWELERCASCGYVQVTRPPTQEELDAIYSASYFSHSKYRDTHTLHKEYHSRLELMKKYLSPSCAVLDYGCAKADFMAYGKDLYTFSGADYAPEAIGAAKALYPDMAERLMPIGQVEQLPDSTFSGIVMWDVIEHLWDPIAALEQLLPKLESGGYLFLSTPRIDTFFARLTGKYWPFMTPPEHLGFFSRKAFKELAGQLTLEILEEHSRGKWVNIGFLFYKLKRIFPKLIPSALIRLFQTRWLSGLAVYIPTGDIQYLVMRKRIQY